MRSQLTETFKRVQGMIDYVRENLDEEEYDLFLDLIAPEPERVVEKVKPKKPKKILYCEVCDYTKRHQVHKDMERSDYHEFQPPKSSSKSKRAKSIEGAIQKTPKVKVDDDDVLDFNASDLCDKCGKPADENHHHLATHPNYHEFTVGESHALAAGGE